MSAPSNSGDARRPVVLDTNVFVASGFNPHSASARIVEAVRAGRLRMAWNADTRAETRRVLWTIPPLSWDLVSDLFRRGGREGDGRAGSFDCIADAADRKFAALASAAGGVLVTLDDDLLACRERMGIPVLTPQEFQARYVWE